MDAEAEKTAHVTFSTNWLERGRLRRILQKSSLDFTEDRKLFRATFEADLTADQYDILMAYWSSTPGVHITRLVVE